METSTLRWTHHTLNFWYLCQTVSNWILPSDQNRRVVSYPDLFLEGASPEPCELVASWDHSARSRALRWQKGAREQGARRRVLSTLMNDFFQPEADEFRPAAWEIIRECDQLDWLILTKQPELIADRLPPDWGDGYPNVWLGVTCSNESFLWRVDELQQVPAAVRIAVAEPLLGPIDFSRYLGSIQWIVTGCGVGAESRCQPMDLDWVRAIDQQCRNAGVAHYLNRYYIGEQLRNDGLLDGQVRREFPSVASLKA
jgi:protein gp37